MLSDSMIVVLFICNWSICISVAGLYCVFVSDIVLMFITGCHGEDCPLLQVVMVKIARWHWRVYMHTRTHGSCDAGIHCILCINLYLYFLQVVVLKIVCRY